VTYRCPSNTAVQVYNYQHKTARVVFGPELVILDPHETFNVLFLSGEFCEHQPLFLHAGVVNM
jgi:major vault protein